MAQIRPFKATRPPRDKVHLVASRSYVSYSWHALRRKLDENPYTFIHIINPEYSAVKKSRANSPERFRKVRKKFEAFCKNGTFQRDEREMFYIYRQKKGKHSWTGIIAAISTDDYRNNVIKKHENTLTEREEVFKRYLRITRINAEPVLMTYPDDPKTEAILKKYTGNLPEYDFTTTDRLRQTLWLIDQPEDIRQLQENFAGYKSLYLADGHHRTASSTLLADELRKEDPKDRDAPYNYFMGYFIPEKNLDIFSFHRLVKDIDPGDKSRFIAKLEKSFNVKKETEYPGMVPTRLNQIGMWLQKEYYILTAIPGTFNKSNPVDGLDVSILSNNIFKPLLGITDERNDNRVQFVGGENQAQKVESLIQNNRFTMAFLLHPVTVSQLKKVADAGLTMPPKSTYIEPKLRSGLTIYEF